MAQLNSQLSNWVKNARLHAGLSQEKLGEVIGRTKQNVWNMENGKHEPSYSQLIAIATATKYPVPFPGLDYTVDAVQEGYIELTHYDVQSSAGHTPLVSHKPNIKRIQVAKNWASDFLGSLVVDKIKLIDNKGVSMHPTINDGDVLLVDISCTYYDGDGIYIISDDGELKTKRLIKEEGVLRIVSDNPSNAYKERVISAKNQDTLIICGKVKKNLTVKDVY